MHGQVLGRVQSAGAECRCLGTGRAGGSEQRGGSLHRTAPTCWSARWSARWAAAGVRPCLRSGAKPIAGSPTKEAPSRSTSSAPGLITVKPSSVGATPVAWGTTVRTMVHAWYMQHAWYMHGASHRGPGAPRYAVRTARPRLVRVRRTRCSRRASCLANPARTAHRRPVRVRALYARRGCGTPWLRVNTAGHLHGSAEDEVDEGALAGGVVAEQQHKRQRYPLGKRRALQRAEQPRVQRRQHCRREHLCRLLHVDSHGGPVLRGRRLRHGRGQRTKRPRAAAQHGPRRSQQRRASHNRALLAAGGVTMNEGSNGTVL